MYLVLCTSTEYIFHTHLSTAIYYIHMQSMCYMFYRVVLQKWSEVQAVAVVVDVSNSSHSHRSQYNHGTMILVFPKEKSAFEFYFVLRKLIKTPKCEFNAQLPARKECYPKSKQHTGITVSVLFQAVSNDCPASRFYIDSHLHLLKWF